jgi:hypothetical protein
VNADQTNITAADSTPASTETTVSNDPLAIAEGSRVADQHVLSSTDWILGIGQRIQDWLGSSSLGTDAPQAPQAETARLALLSQLEGDGQSLPRGDVLGRIEQASFEVPLGVILTTAIVYLAKDPIRRWWKKDARRFANLVLRRNQAYGGKPIAGRHKDRAKGTKATINIFRGPHFGPRSRPIEAGDHHLHHRESTRVRQK